MPNSLKNTPHKIPYAQSGSVEKAQQGSANAIMDTLSITDTIVWLTPTEEFLGRKYVAVIAQLVWEARDKYIALVTTPDTFKPVLSSLIKNSQISERVSVSRVIAFIQASI